MEFIVSAWTSDPILNFVTSNNGRKLISTKRMLRDLKFEPAVDMIEFQTLVAKKCLDKQYSFVSAILDTVMKLTG